MRYVIAALYQFTKLDPDAHRGPLADAVRAAGVKGTLLLASEGINGTIAGSRAGIDAVLAAIRELPGCDQLEWKESEAAEMPFRRLKVRVKQEIVTLGVDGVDPATRVGTYVAPRDWNAVIDDPDTVTIDTRNDYEVAIGRFDGAVDPVTPSFRDFPDWWARNREHLQGKRVAMYCTGGIRCEKASSFLLEQGVPEVLHLKGGILKYLEEVPREQSRWTGECFVFDGRVAVGHALEEGTHSLCHACGRAVPEAARSHPDFCEGISCAACIAEYTDADRARFSERQKQLVLARERGELHLSED